MQMCSLRDAAADFTRLGVTVYGISLDDVQTQAKFKEKQKLNFDLLSDPTGSVAQRYGVLIERMPMARRVTFLIDDEGVLRQINEKVDVRNHASQIVESIEQLRNKAP